jgi:pre-mRNA-processing factor 17
MLFRRIHTCCALNVQARTKESLLRCAHAGPAHPFTRDGIAAGLRNHRAGHVEDAHLHPLTFNDQFHTMNTYGCGTA